MKVYELLYDYTRVTELETKRYYYRKEEVKVKIRTRSNELLRATLNVKVNDAEGDVVYSREESIDVNSKLDVSFKLPDNAKNGVYTITAELYGLEMEMAHSMKRDFIVVN